MSLNQRIRKKIKSHKNSDWLMYREYKERDYITVDWIKQQLAKSSRCKLCLIQMKLINWDPDDPHQFSIDRLKNWLPHIKSNCQITCLQCNRKKEKETIC